MKLPILSVQRHSPESDQGPEDGWHQPGITINQATGDITTKGAQ